MLIPTKFEGYDRSGRRLYFLKLGGNSAPQADPQMGAAANRQIALAEKQYADYNAPGGDREWMRATAEEYMADTRKTSASARELSGYQLEQMKFNDDRYKTVAIPFENRLLKDVERFDSQGYKDQQVSTALADVQAATDNAEQQQQRSQSRMGVDPSSGRALAMSNQMALGKASALAGTATRTRMAADQIGLSSKMQMYGGMKGLAGLGNVNASLAQSSMGTGLNAGGAGVNAVSGSLQANNQAFSSSMNGVSAGINGLGQYTQLNQNATKINNDADPTASLIGAGAMVGAAYL